MTSAQEDSPLARALEYVAQADFGAALEAFEQAEASTRLSRAELIELYAHRALARFALGEAELMQADLARLHAIAPEAPLPATAPPPVREAYERVRQAGSRLQVVARAESLEGGRKVARMGSRDSPRRTRAERATPTTRSAIPEPLSQRQAREDDPGRSRWWWAGAGAAAVAIGAIAAAVVLTRAHAPASTVVDAPILLGPGN